MSGVFQRGRLLCKSAITGPKHVLLGIEFTSAPSGEVVIEQLPATREGCTHGGIDEALLMAAVDEGLTEAGSKVIVTRLAYVPTDTPSYDLYRRLAREIAEHYLGSASTT